MMTKEFPSLAEKDYQQNFLADWYHPSKIFIGKRMSGKTELMISELRRFERYDFSCIFISPYRKMQSMVDEKYQSRFGEKMTSQTLSIDEVEEGKMRGRNPDVVIVDEIQHMPMPSFKRELLPSHPSFLRASLCASNGIDHPLYEEPEEFFDSVHRLE